MLIYLADIEADSLYTEGMVLYDRGEFAQAIAVLQEVIERYPQHPQRGRGTLHYRRFPPSVGATGVKRPKPTSGPLQFSKEEKKNGVP